MIGSSSAASAAINSVPMSWFTSITEAGGAVVTGSANAAGNAIRSIPTSWSTTLSIASAAAVESAANAATNAINSIPFNKTITIMTVGGVSRATSGRVNEPFTRLDDGNGPEMLRYPGGAFRLGHVDGVYRVPRGTMVYTAEQARRMMKLAQGIPAFAFGGVVGRSAPYSRSASMPRGGGNVYTNSPITVNAEIHTQGRMDESEKREFAQEFATAIRDGANLVHLGKGGA